MSKVPFLFAGLGFIGYGIIVMRTKNDLRSTAAPAAAPTSKKSKAIVGLIFLSMGLAVLAIGFLG